MAFPGGNPLPFDLDLNFKTCLAGISFFAIAGLVISKISSKYSLAGDCAPGIFKSLILFSYSCFLKPLNGDENGTQQDSLESFYKSQAGIYDRTRGILLRGREDMLALLASQLLTRSEIKKGNAVKPIWVDVS